MNIKEVKSSIYNHNAHNQQSNNSKDYFTELGEVSGAAGCESETLQQHRKPPAFRSLWSRICGIEVGAFHCRIRNPPAHLLQEKSSLESANEKWKRKLKRERERDRESTGKMRGEEKRRWRRWGSGRGLGDPWRPLLWFSRLGKFYPASCFLLGPHPTADKRV